MLKMQQDQEQQRIEERLAQLQMEADEKDRINKEYVKELFKKQDQLGGEGLDANGNPISAADA